MLPRLPDRLGLPDAPPWPRAKGAPIRTAPGEDAPQRIVYDFGTRTPPRAQSGELSEDQQAPQFTDEVKRRGTGPYVRL